MNDLNEKNLTAETTEAFEVLATESNERLDSFLVKRFPQFSRVKLQRAIASHEITVDGRPAKSSLRLKPAQIVSVGTLTPDSEAPIPEKIELDILFEDESLVAINKPPGMVVHPAKGHWSGTLTAALAFHFEQLSSVGGPTRPGVVHRLDRDTSGVILIAKNDAAHLALSAQFENRTVAKQYLAITTPAPDRDRDLIEKPIGDHPYQREKKAIREDHPSSRSASTFYEVTERFAGFAAVTVKPKTGRTHQIRVHLAHIGCPVLCDALYSGRARITNVDFDRSSGNDEVVLDRQALHAARIEFAHPESGKAIMIEAPLPTDILRTLDLLRKFRRA